MPTFLERIGDAAKRLHETVGRNWGFQGRGIKGAAQIGPETRSQIATALAQAARDFAEDHEQHALESHEVVTRARNEEERQALRKTILQAQSDAGFERAKQAVDPLLEQMKSDATRKIDTAHQEARLTINRATAAAVSAMMRQHFKLGAGFDGEALIRLNDQVRKETGKNIHIGDLELFSEKLQPEAVRDRLLELKREYENVGKIDWAALRKLQFRKALNRARDYQSLTLREILPESMQDRDLLHIYLTSYYGNDFANRALKEIRNHRTAAAVLTSWVRPEVGFNNLFGFRNLSSADKESVLAELKNPLRRKWAGNLIGLALLAGGAKVAAKPVQFVLEHPPALIESQIQGIDLEEKLRELREKTPQPKPTKSPVPAPTKAAQPISPFWQYADQVVTEGPKSVLNITTENMGINRKVLLAAIQQVAGRRTFYLGEMRLLNKRLIEGLERGVKAGDIEHTKYDPHRAVVYTNLLGLYKHSKGDLKRYGIASRGDFEDVMKEYARLIKLVPVSEGRWSYLPEVPDREVGAQPGKIKSELGSVDLPPKTTGWARKLQRALGRKKA